MTRNVPHQKLFDQARLFDKIQTIVLAVATVITAVSIILNGIQKNKADIYLDQYIDWANGVSSLLSIGYIVLDILTNIKFFKAGKEKRVDLIDHAFETNFSGEKSTGYFNPGGINKGLYKLAVLSFENSLFTASISKKMTGAKWGYAVVVCGIFIISACMGNKELVNNLIQIAAAGVLVQQAIKLQQFSDRMYNIHDDFKTLFSNLKDVTDKTKGEGEMVRYVLNYEATHSWGSILLDEDIFKKDNNALSQRWETMKQEYKI